jgi:rhombotail lipoprotein
VPTKLALAAVSDGYLSAIGAEELQRWEAIVQGVPYIEGVMPVTALSIGSTNVKLHDLRTAAAGMGCELLLLYHVSDSGVDNYTDAAALYWTFVGLWLAPGNLYEHRTVMQAIIVDCRTGVILGTATGDSHLRAACPAAFGKVQEDKLAQEAWQKAMDDLLKACKPVLKAIVSKAAQPRR